MYVVLSHENCIWFASVALMVKGGVLSFVYPVCPVNDVIEMLPPLGAVLSIANELSDALKSVSVPSLTCIVMK